MDDGTVPFLSLPSVMDPSSDNPLRNHLARLLDTRTPPKTFCPSEVARALSGGELASLGYEHWRAAMPAIREIVWQLRARGECEVLQKGQVLDDDDDERLGPEDVTGPIRVRRK